MEPPTSSEAPQPVHISDANDCSAVVPANGVVESGQAKFPPSAAAAGHFRFSEAELLANPDAIGAPKFSLNDPNFVQNFFKNSRLHFIGSWNTRFEVGVTIRQLWSMLTLPIPGAS
jgi:DNA repair protein REV1